MHCNVADAKSVDRQHGEQQANKVSTCRYLSVFVCGCLQNYLKVPLYIIDNTIAIFTNLVIISC